MSGVVLRRGSPSPGESDLDEWLGAAKALARRAGRMQLEGHSGADDGCSKFTIDEKSVVDLVTSVDKACEALIFETLKEKYAHHKFIGEESAAEVELGDDLTWCVDPVDGTSNYVHNFPAFCVSIGLFYEKKPILGVIFDPSKDEMYEAVRGRGAFCNGERLRVDSADTLPKAVVATNFGHTRDEDFVDSQIRGLRRLCDESIRGVRMIGSCCISMALVAKGVLSCYYEANVGGLWDVAAGAIIIEEAGGVIANVRTGAPYTFEAGKQHVCCGNEKIVAQVLRVLRDETNE